MRERLRIARGEMHKIHTGCGGNDPDSTVACAALKHATAVIDSKQALGFRESGRWLVGDL